MRKTICIQQQSMLSVSRLETARRLVACVEVASYTLLRRQILSVVAICSIVWLASLWLGAAITQAQDSPSNESGITVTRPALPSTASAETSHFVLGMVDRRELDQPLNSATQLTNTHATQPDSAAPLLLPSNPRGEEFASWAALASAPSSSLLSAIQAAGAEHTDAASPAGSNKTVVYQLGPVDFVINGLPDSFSVSSAGSGVAGAR